MSAHAVRHAPYREGKYAPVPHSIVHNLALLTRAELMLAVIVARRTEQSADATVPDGLWEKWTGLSPRMKEYAAAGLRGTIDGDGNVVGKRLLCLKGLGGGTQYSLDLRGWNRYCASADKPVARTEGRADSTPAPKPVHPECRENGCAMARKALGFSGRPENGEIAQIEQVPVFATAVAQPVAQTPKSDLGFPGRGRGRTEGEVLHEAPGMEAARMSVEGAAVTGPILRKPQPSDAPVAQARREANNGRKLQLAGADSSPEGCEAGWPVSMASMREFFVTMGGALLERILAIVLALFPDLTDQELATAVMHATNPRTQTSAALWLTTLPAAIKNLRAVRAGGGRVREYGGHGGVARAAPDWEANTPPSYEPAYEPEPEDARSAWADIRRFLKKRISGCAYENWLARTRVMGVEGRELRVRVPDAVTREWIEAEYAEDIRAAVKELGLEIDAVAFVHVAAREVSS